MGNVMKIPARPQVKCAPFVRQCGIIEVYQLKI